MLNLVRKSLQVELTLFMNLLSKTEGMHNVTSITNSAFNQNRMKISPLFFKEINKILVDEFYADNDANVKLWKGFRLLAVDGSKITLPNTKTLKQIYGVTKNQHATEIVQARASFLYDINNDMIIDAKISSSSIGERELCKGHLVFCHSDEDLIIFDRGYPSFELVYELKQRGIHFLMRCKTKFNQWTKILAESQSCEMVIELSPSSHHSFNGLPYNKEERISVRLVKVILESGEVEILMTDLMDPVLYPLSIFKELYFKRWGVETSINRVKNIIQVEKFTGHTPDVIRQDFFASAFMHNVQSLLISELEEQTAEKYQGRKYKYKINRNISLGFLKNEIICLFFTQDTEGILKRLYELFIQHVVPIRPNRKYPRNTSKYRSRTRPPLISNLKSAI